MPDALTISCPNCHASLGVSFSVEWSQHTHIDSAKPVPDYVVGADILGADTCADHCPSCAYRKCIHGTKPHSQHDCESCADPDCPSHAKRKPERNYFLVDNT